MGYETLPTPSFALEQATALLCFSVTTVFQLYFLIRTVDLFVIIYSLCNDTDEPG
jgi:hypothetical protein